MILFRTCHHGPNLNMPLSANQLRYLRQLAHPLKPVVMIGAKGVTEAVCKELNLALDQHELLKVKLSGDREQRTLDLEKLVAATHAEGVQIIGHVASLYRPHPEQPKLALPR